MPVLPGAHVTGWVGPAIHKDQLLDGCIAEPFEDGRHLSGLTMNAGIFAVVEHQHQNLDRRQVLLGYRAGLPVTDHAGGQHEPRNRCVLYLDRHGRGGNRAPAGANNPDRRCTLFLDEVEHSANIRQVRVTDYRRYGTRTRPPA